MRITSNILWVLLIAVFFSSCQSFKTMTYKGRKAKQDSLVKKAAEQGGYKKEGSDKKQGNNSNTDRIADTVEEVKLDPNKKLTPFEYIDLYKSYAIASMKKKGVPASITLAQGLLESGVGNSYLAREAKNHFGVKVGGTWDGPYVLRDDDRKNEKFRKYKSVLHSYEDHGDFLRSRSWYAPLFKLKITDYKGWAYGLKKAGYATDPKYPRKLINVIEKYKLNEYDKIGKNN